MTECGLDLGATGTVMARAGAVARFPGPGDESPHHLPVQSRAGAFDGVLFGNPCAKRGDQRNTNEFTKRGLRSQNRLETVIRQWDVQPREPRLPHTSHLVCVQDSHQQIAWPSHREVATSGLEWVVVSGLPRSEVQPRPIMCGCSAAQPSQRTVERLAG